MSMSILEWSAIILVIVINFYLYGTCFYIYLNKRGVKTSRPRVPFFGDFYDILRRKKNLIQAIDKTYNAFPCERYVGFFEVVGEIIILKDVELIRKVCVEAADHFLDHRKIILEHEASLFSKHLFSLKGQKWRDMRAAMDPAFGDNRMNRMFSLVFKSSENITSHVVELSKQTNGEVCEIEIKNLFSRHLNDVIALCAFASEVDTLRNPKNEIYSNGQIISKTNFFQFANIMAYSSKFLKTLNLKKPDERACNFFRALVSNKMKEREQNGTTGHDFLQYLIDVKKGSVMRNTMRKNSTDEMYTSNGSFEREWTDDDFLAQTLCFYIGGLSTMGSVLTFLFYELAINTHIQTKLQEEIDRANIESDYNVTYENIIKLEYLDMVVSETLRKWPPIIATDRECVKPYTLPPANENAKVYTFLSKYAIWIPIYSIHHDPVHFPNPEIFDPDRFSKQNKDNIKPYTFIPFGVGVRNCIGSKFALALVKTTVFHLLSKINFVSISKTVPDIPVENEGLILKPKNECWLGIKLRSYTS